MGVFFPLTFLFILFLIPPLFAYNYNYNNFNNTNTNISSNNVVDNITASNPSPYPYLQQTNPNSFPFKPTIAVILGVLTTVFSITFLFFVYAKHCRRDSNLFTYSHGHSYTHASSLVAVSARRNSGINRAVVESLPLFRFSSLSGQKDGLECAVCLTRFEPSELLRLLPKCKHAFHVECVDTWLDAHSTCPLCRYRVDPEDILLIEKDYASRQNQDPAAAVSASSSSSCFESAETEPSRTRRVSGRHSYAGERATSIGKTTWFRRSLDSSGGDGAVGAGGLGYRKDGLLLVREEDEKKRLEHRIIVSGSGGGGGGGGGSGLESGFHQRWSDVQPSDLLYLRSEMIISQTRRSGKAIAEATNDNIINRSNGIGNGKEENGSEPEISIGIDGIGRSVINSRSVSEITALSRFSSKVSNNNDGDNNNTRHHHRRPEGQAAAAGLVSRWLALISSTSHSDVRSQPVETITGLS